MMFANFIQITSGLMEDGNNYREILIILQEKTEKAF